MWSPTHLSLVIMRMPCTSSPFQNLRADALDQAERPLVLNDKLHDFDEALEGLALPLRRRWTASPPSATMSGAGYDGGQGLGHGAEGEGLHGFKLVFPGNSMSLSLS